MQIQLRPIYLGSYHSTSGPAQLGSIITTRLIIAAAIISTLTSGCFVQFGNTNTQSGITSDSLQQLIKNNKFFIVHFQDKSIALKNPTLSGQNLIGETMSIPTEHQNFLHAKRKSNKPLPEGKFRIKNSQKIAVFNEVHIYTDTPLEDKTGVSVATNGIYRIDIFSFDIEATKNNKTNSIVGLSIGTALVILLFILLSTIDININP